MTRLPRSRNGAGRQGRMNDARTERNGPNQSGRETPSASALPAEDRPARADDRHRISRRGVVRLSDHRADPVDAGGCGAGAIRRRAPHQAGCRRVHVLLSGARVQLAHFARHVLGAAAQHADRRVRRDRAVDAGRRNTGLAPQPQRHVRPALVRDRVDRSLHAAGLDLRARLDDLVQEPHRRRPAGLDGIAGLRAARLAFLRPGAGDHHPGAALLAFRHPAFRQRAAPLRYAARGFGPHPGGEPADRGAQDHPALDAAVADLGHGADLRQEPRRIRRALCAGPAGRFRRPGDLPLPQHSLAPERRRRGARGCHHADRDHHHHHRCAADEGGAASSPSDRREP